ncbi:centromere protein P [Syngnathoides biaculeatus]|uniref:centromere protein P n=1 Tax=Syngnathoides biaculeatus TaxID=300417 RepID=UPI002ADD7355|nr:centromere protein P [Syngnathoides biaculeatus]XP_061687460.1 centromere protein P [Syngnathoides biaculeatus]XP_061687461.1 centromere protein P [Syngnathoides biaculeatus]
MEEERMNEQNAEEVKTLEEVKMLEDNIRHLQAEVADLQRQRHSLQEDLSQPMRDALSLLCGRKLKGGAHQVLSSLREEVDQLEDELRRQSRMNGISLKSCTSRTLQSGSTKSVQMCVFGQCSELEFQVEFQLSEVKTGERPEKTIDSLNVVMGDCDLQNSSSFLSGVKESKDLLLFFRTLRTFGERMDERRRTFQHFQAKYPNVVCVPGGCSSPVLTLNHPQLPGCTLLVHWFVDVSKEGKVAPKLDLLTKIPNRALQLFPSQAVGGAAEAFHSLLRLLGPEAALEEVIRAAGLITHD